MPLWQRALKRVPELVRSGEIETPVLEHPDKLREVHEPPERGVQWWLSDIRDEALRALADALAHLGDAAEVAVMPTIDEVVERYLACHDCDPATTTKLKRQLEHAQGAFATRPVDLLEPFELSEWRMTLSDGVRHDVFRALRQVLEQARRWGWLKANPAAVVKNPKPKRGEIRIFPAWADVDAIVDELPTVYKPLPVFIVGTGVRPEELVGAATSTSPTAP